MFHNEDKRATSLRIYCPCLYFEFLETTFADPKVFRRLDASPSHLIHTIMEKLTKRFKKSYPWSLGRGRELPNAYILPKQKKAIPFWSSHRELLLRPISTYAQLHSQAHLPTHPSGISPQPGRPKVYKNGSSQKAIDLGCWSKLLQHKTWKSMHGRPFAHAQYRSEGYLSPPGFRPSNQELCLN